MVEEEKASIPPGTRVLNEGERIQTLEDLKDAKREICLALDKLPVGTRTMEMERYKRECERKVNSINKAIDTFSKKMLYVRY